MSRRTVEAEPQNANSLDTYAWILHLLGRDAEALGHIERALAINATDATYLRHRDEIKKALQP